MTTDQLDPIVDAHFGGMRSLEPPDLWPRIAAQVPPPARRGRVWWASAAAAVLLVTGATAVIVVRGGDGARRTIAPADPPATAGASPTTPAPATPAPGPGADAPLPTFGDAIVAPAVVSPGDAIRVTPDGVVDRVCADVASVYRYDGGAGELLGLLSPGGAWQSAAEGITQLTLPACEAPPSDHAVTYRLPADLGPGDHVVCLRVFGDPFDAGCGAFRVLESAGTHMLVAALESVGAAVAAMPDDLSDTGGAPLCGVVTRPSGGTLPSGADAMSCFLDAHLVGAPALVVDVAITVGGDPLVTVWRTGADGTATDWTDSTRDRFGSGTWERSECPGLDLGPGVVPRLLCARDGEPGPVAGEPLPLWFAQRAPLPSCGHVPLGSDPAEAVACFDDALATGAAAEVAYVVDRDGARSVRWLRATQGADAPVEVVEQRTVPGSAPVWLRYECGPVDLLDGDGTGDLPGLPPLDGRICVGTEVDADGDPWFTVPSSQIAGGGQRGAAVLSVGRGEHVATIALEMVEREGVAFLELRADAVPEGAAYWVVEVDGQLRSRTTAHAGSTHGIRLAPDQTGGIDVAILAVDADGVIVAAVG